MNYKILRKMLVHGGIFIPESSERSIKGFWKDSETRKDCTYNKVIKKSFLDFSYALCEFLLCDRVIEFTKRSNKHKKIIVQTSLLHFLKEIYKDGSEYYSKYGNLKNCAIQDLHISAILDTIYNEYIEAENLFAKNKSNINENEKYGNMYGYPKTRNNLRRLNDNKEVTKRKIFDLMYNVYFDYKKKNKFDDEKGFDLEDKFNFDMNKLRSRRVKLAKSKNKIGTGDNCITTDDVYNVIYLKRGTYDQIDQSIDSAFDENFDFSKF